MKRLFFLLVLFPMPVSAADADNKSQATENKLQYSVSPESGMKYQEKKYYLIKSGETWAVSRSGDLSQDNVERVAVNLSSGVITLTALPPNTQGLGNFSRNEWPCYKGLVLNPAVRAFRRADSYSLCKSEFAKNIDNPMTMVGGAVTAIVGVVRSLVAVDQEKILAIAESSGLIEMVEQDRQAATGAEYHALFAAATTPGLIKSFAAKYQADDPENLVPQAQARLQRAEIEQCRNSFISATTQVSLKNFIAKYEGNDPENLVFRARKRLQDMEQLAAKSEADRLHHLENKQIGDQVCSSGDGSVDQSTGIVVMGEHQYRKIYGRNRVVGFIEGLSGKKVQIRISGINFTGGGINQSLDSLSGWKGGSTLKINSIIWDSTYDWDGCGG